MSNQTITAFDRHQQQADERRDHAAAMAAEHLAPGTPTVVADAVFSLAWEHGHSSGWSEIENFYIDFAALANIAFKAGRDSGQE